MKKIISLTLSLIMIFSVFAFHSSAAFSLFGSLPTVTSLEFTNSVPISKADVKEYGLIGLDDYALDLNFSSLTYKFKAVLSNGKEVKFTSDDFIVDLGDNLVLIYTAYVSNDNYNKAIKGNKKTVNVDVECSVSRTGSSILGSLMQSETEKQKFTLKRKLKKRYVNKIKYVSGLQKSVYKGADYIDLSKAKFSVEYSSGKKKTYTCKENFYDGSIPALSGYSYYTLNGMLISYEITKKGVNFYYADAPKYSKKLKIKANPYKSIKITDYNFDNAKGLQSVTYKVTKKNGNSNTYTFDTSKYADPIMGVPSMRINKLDGYSVSLSPYDYNAPIITEDGTIIEEELNENNVTIFISLGDSITDSVSFEVEPTQEVKFDFSSILGYLKTALDYLMSMISGAKG